MAKTPKKKRPARRLKNVVVEEVSLVDSPAVPEANFIVAKREKVEESAEGDPGEAAEVTKTEDVDLEKGRLLTAKQAARLEKIRDELDDILKTSRRVMKGEELSWQESVDSLSEAERQHLLSPSADTVGSAIQQAEQLIKAREQNQKTNLDNQVISKLDEALSQITKTSERTSELETKFLEATGKAV